MEEDHYWLFFCCFFFFISSSSFLSVKEATDAANTLIKGPFCFIQTSEGKVVLVAHDPNEKPAVVNLKKAIASAFQANFKNTAREEEEDAQSRHISHYR